MLQKIIFCLILILPLYSGFSQEKTDDLPIQVSQDSIYQDDGPYIFIESGKLISKSIIDHKVVSQEIAITKFDTIFDPEKSIFKKASKVAALSDIHGQYDLAVEILQNNKIIDKNLNWIYGTGHFVIVGDVFDRGEKVNEILWLIYKLEKQAKQNGGAVHYLLGNHEFMILHGNYNYVNPKYMASANLLNHTYGELYGNNTVLGRWLRSKNTLVKINGNTFVHGGISNEFTANGYDISKINNLMRRSIDNMESIEMENFEAIYFGNSSPIWYRGYFYDKLPETAIDSILNTTKSKHIIVGHCSNEEVVQLYNQKIFGVDSSIKNGEYGEILFISPKGFNRGTLKGEAKPFKLNQE